MSQWKLAANNSSNTTGPIEVVSMSLHQGAGHTAQLANNSSLVQNSSVGAIKIHGANSSMIVGQYPFTAAAYANGGGEVSKAKTGGPGWVLRRAYMGGIVGFTANGGSNIANGETVTITGGTANATITLTSNVYTNLTNLSVTGSATGLGNANTGVLTVSNTNGIAVANATFTSNSTGGLVNGGISIVSGGLFANGQTNAGLVVSAVWSNGTTANVTGLTFVANASANTIMINPGAAVLSSPGTFANLSSTSNTLVRQLHLTNLSVTGTDTGLGNANTGYSVVANGTAIAANVAWTSNSTGGLANTNITIPPTTVGLFPANQTNAGLVVTSFWSNGAAANVTGLTFVANVGPSTGGAVTVKTLGGRAGRVLYETLVSSRFIANGNLANSTNSFAGLPQ